MCWTDFVFFLRVLQNSGGVAITARPTTNRAVAPSPKAASEVPKSSSPPKPGLCSPPVPTLGRGYTEGEDIFLDMSPPPCSKSISAAKVCVPCVTGNKIRQAAWWDKQYKSFILAFFFFSLSLELSVEGLAGCWSWEKLVSFVHAFHNQIIQITICSCY